MRSQRYRTISSVFWLLALLSGGVKISATTTQSGACLQNLRMIDGAKEQLALEKKLAEGTVVDASEVSPYIKGSTMPECPGGGIYTIGKIGEDASCSIRGHSIAGVQRARVEWEFREVIIIVAITVFSIAVAWLITGAIVVGLRDRKAKRSPHSKSVEN